MTYLGDTAQALQGVDTLAVFRTVVPLSPDGRYRHIPHRPWHGRAGRMRDARSRCQDGRRHPRPQRGGPHSRLPCALAAATGFGSGRRLVANNCIDATEAVARAAATSAGMRLDVIKSRSTAKQGWARHAGWAARMPCISWPAADALLFTDADCLTGPDWIARNPASSVACGSRLRAGRSHAGRALRPGGHGYSLAEMEGRYEALVTAFYRRHRPGPLGLDGEHAHAAGASLAVRGAATGGRWLSRIWPPARIAIWCGG